MEVDTKQLQQDGLRIDGRRPKEIRKINVRLGVFGQADGSAYVEQGKTKVLATVYGPHQPRGSAAKNVSTKTVKGIVNCQYSTAVFSFGAGERKRRPRGDRKSLERSLQLRHAMEAIIHLDLMARSQIDIFVEILQVDGSEFCVAVNAATLALVDAGIPIKDYAVGCSVTVADSAFADDKGTQGIGLLDANYMEECMPGVTLSIVSLPGLHIEIPIGNTVVVVQGSGQRLHLSRLEALRMMAVEGCRDIRAILDESVKHHLNIYSSHTVD